MELSIQEELAAQAIGTAALEYQKQIWTPARLAQETENRVLKTLEDIRRVLNDDDLEDPECFRRIEAIVKAMEENGLYTTRHNF